MKKYSTEIFALVSVILFAFIVATYFRLNSIESQNENLQMQVNELEKRTR